MKPPYLHHLREPNDLVTSREAYRAGFVALALERNTRATPFVARARDLKAAAARAKAPIELLAMKDIQAALLTAAGVSDKAAAHLDESDRREAILGLIRNFLEPSGADFVEELVYRFLLTRGDTLGGTMRNLGGVLAQRRFTASLIAQFQNAGRPCWWLPAAGSEWQRHRGNGLSKNDDARALAWEIGSAPRVLCYNVRVPVSRTHVDICLLNCPREYYGQQILQSPANYIALGELKGGIDPNGADEHWKTARTALSRIHEAFARHQLRPRTFFVGAAIEPKMAMELWSFLENGIIENAANLNYDSHTASLTRWLSGL